MARLREKILELLHRYPKGLRQADIARILSASRSRVSEVVSELEKAGLVVRVREGSIVLVKLASTVSKSEPSSSRRLKLGIIWSSEYPFVTPFAKNLRDKLGVELEVVVYTNGLDATWDLVTGRIDLALTPMVTQVLYGALTSRLAIIGGGATGGASILRNPRGREGYGASTRASTMDLLLTLAWRILGRDEKQRIYIDSGDRLLRSLLRGDVELVAIWEPLATKARVLGYKEVISVRELGVTHCCTLSANKGFDQRLLEKISSIYRGSIELFKKNPNRWLEWYSVKTGISVDVLKKSITSYEFNEYVDIHGMEKVFKKCGLRIPSPSIVKEMVSTLA